MIVTNKSELTKECRDVSLIEANNILQLLEKELANSKIAGVGLAANQIGLDAKICIIRAQNKIDFINPTIIEQYDLMEFGNEGCLSFPGQWLLTKRYNEILVKDLWHPAGIILVGVDAVVAQHEIGHLYGETMFEYQIERPQVNAKCWCGSDRKYKKCHMRKVIK
jgi:peptide deformylase